MQTLVGGPICAIVDTPGLYISDITIPCSADILRKYKITHVLSLTNQKYRPNLDEELGIDHQHLAIDDNPFEDLLMSLEGLCAWIDNAIATTHEPRVLVHCIEGISRSGALVVAFLMRNRALDYESALSLARKSRAVIAPNSGFADQLRLWEKMEYSVMEHGDAETWKMKQQYDEWRMNRGVLYSRDEQAKQDATRTAMADMAARLRRCRLKGGQSED
ncbi:Nn.00g101810.m01.CDS01 [Neocucurbitaria sp. VM-36]